MLRGGDSHERGTPVDGALSFSIRAMSLARVEWAALAEFLGCVGLGGGGQGGVLCPQRMVVHAPPNQDLAGSFGGGGGVRKVLCEVLERVQE